MVRHPAVLTVAGVALILGGLALLLARLLPHAYWWARRMVARGTHRAARVRMLRARRPVQPHRAIRVLRRPVLPPPQVAPRPRSPHGRLVDAPTRVIPALADQTVLLPRPRVGDR